ncbi:hypothetical protein LPJ61_005570, partial [Coemansia biformis]
MANAILVKCESDVVRAEDRVLQLSGMRNVILPQHEIVLQHAYSWVDKAATKADEAQAAANAAH